MRWLRLAGLAALCLLVLVLGGSLVFGLLGRRGAPTPAAPGAAARGERVRVEVLNASRTSGLARAATERLRTRGFDVVYFGNASGFGPDSSLVLDRVGRPESARAVAEALGLARVLSQPDSSRYVDVTVVLGRDWARGAAADSAAAAGDTLGG